MLKELLTSCEFKEDGLYLGNSSLDLLKVYHFLHSAIADDHLPVWKVCGFNVSSSTNIKGKGSATERCINLMENNIEVSYNLTDKVFIDPVCSMASIVEYDGDLDVVNNESPIMCGSKPVKILSTNSHIFTSMDPVTIRLKLYQGTGYMAMKDTYAMMCDNAYFPMAVRFSINDFCRIKPPMFKDHVAYVLSGGLTADDLRHHFLALLSMSNALPKEDSKWLLNFER